MTKSVVKSFRIDPDLWLWVVDRAAKRRLTASAWLVRCVEDAKMRVAADEASADARAGGTGYVKVADGNIERMDPARVFLAKREVVHKDGDITNHTRDNLSLGPVARKPGAMLKKDRKA